MTAQPPPGSREAVSQGCTCPVLDNGYGAGSWRVDEAGQPLYWKSEGCPLHSLVRREEERAAIINNDESKEE